MERRGTSVILYDRALGVLPGLVCMANTSNVTYPKSEKSTVVPILIPVHHNINQVLFNVAADICMSCMSKSDIYI